MHVFDPELGSYAPGRAYTPEDATFESLIKFESSISSHKLVPTLVLVQPSPYHTDNSVLKKILQGLKAQNKRSFGIAVVEIEQVSDTELEELHELGVRGIRLNLVSDGKEIDLPLLKTTLQRAADRVKQLPGWMIQVFIPGKVWECRFNPALSQNQWLLT